MLKIRDDVDLKELEKYGFKYKDYGDDCPFWEYDMKDNRTYLIIDVKTKEIGIPTGLYGDIPNTYISNFGVLYDLIKDDLVEKAEDK